MKTWLTLAFVFATVLAITFRVPSLGSRPLHNDEAVNGVKLAELIDRGYQDAYRQFIDPVVGASGERLEIGGGGRARGAAPPADEPARGAPAQAAPGKGAN